MKSYVRSILKYLGNNVPWLMKFVIILLYPFPQIFVVVAKLAGMPQAVTDRTWRINSGPLRGFQLMNLLPLEIEPVLINKMEIKCSNILNKVNLKSGIVLDVGASYGYYSLLLSRSVGTGRVYTFEPDWRTYGRLVENLTLNAVQNVVPVPVCLSDSAPALLIWNSCVEDPWNSGIANDQNVFMDSRTVVPVISIDDFSVSLDIKNKIRFIKIDVEGAELSVLKGAIHVIEESQPLLLCELHSAELAKQCFSFFTSKDYEWEMVEYMSETRQHIFAFPASQSEVYRRLFQN